MNNKEKVVTPEGLKALEDELEELKTVKRKEVAEKIKVARGFGDLSENSEYDEAKNEQGLIESRIIFLEKMLKNVRVLDHSELTNDEVMVGSKVKITIMFRGREMAHPEQGLNVLERLAQDLKPYATVESAPKLEGRNMLMLLAPIKGAFDNEEGKEDAAKN